jgi:hypothetical protein
MMRSFFALPIVLGLCTIAPAAPVASAATEASFGCDARAPSVCYFRIFYARGDRIVVLPAGTKQKVPGIVVGRDSYCMTLAKAPAFKCARKVISANYNS